MLQLIVFRHEASKHSAKLLNQRCQLELSDKPAGVLFQFLRFDLLICIDLVNTLIKLSNFLTTLLVLSGFVVGKVFKQGLG